MKIAICDDDKKCNDKLHAMLADYLVREKIDKYEISEYTSGVELLDEYSLGTFDIIFLDVEMPGLDGFETAMKIREADLDVDIVFVTYLKDEVQRGFDFNAKGYLYKSVTQEQIDERMNKLINERLRNNRNAFHKIKLKNSGTALLSLARVLYFESYGHDISAVLENETLIFLDSITNLASELEGHGFVRINKSYLVNINHVFNVSGNRVTIIKGADLAVGRAYKQTLTDALAKREAGKWKE